MNEQKFLNGLKALRSELTWGAILFGSLYCFYLFLLEQPHDKIQWVFGIAFGFLIVRNTLSSFIEGYEKKI